MLLIGCKNDNEKVPFGPKPLLLKQLLYAFLRKNKAFRKYRELTDTSPLVQVIKLMTKFPRDKIFESKFLTYLMSLIKLVYSETTI